ncbi:MAG: integral rane protein [Cyanobacteria bacterium RYN_339]|nr:integral rane protein [Cyanobacteria bacterium RYN_339]
MLDARTPFRWDPTTGLATLAAAALCLVPAAGALAAWHLQVDLAAVLRWAVLPALLLLGALEVFLVNRSPLLFNRLAAGLAGGLVATLGLDLVRLPAAYLFHIVPDVVPTLGQLALGETIGIAPSLAAYAVGYGYSYLLIGALLGAAYSLVLGKSHWQRGLAASLAAGLAFAFLPQFQLTVVGMGFDLVAASTVVVTAFAAAGLLLGSLVQRFGRTEANAFRVVFLRTTEVEELAVH